MTPENKLNLARLVEKLAFAVEEDKQNGEDPNLSTKLMQVADNLDALFATSLAKYKKEGEEKK